jgi:hypothetical protein
VPHASHSADTGAGQRGAKCQPSGFLSERSNRIPSLMVDLSPCREFGRLTCEYERSLRVWAQYVFPPRNEREAPLLRHEAQRERDNAAMRLNDHQQTCPVCIWNIHRSPGKHR